MLRKDILPLKNHMKKEAGSEGKSGLKDTLRGPGTTEEIGRGYRPCVVGGGAPLERANIVSSSFVEQILQEAQGQGRGR
jgi:hypothetical protein